MGRSAKTASRRGMMKGRDLQRFRKLLLEEKERLVTKREVIFAENLLGPLGKPADEADIGSHTIDQSLTVRLLSRETRLLKKIETALSKIDRGTFGVCEVCGENIGLKRLRARPVAELCIRCKEGKETGETERNNFHEHEDLWFRHRFHENSGDSNVGH